MSLLRDVLRHAKDISCEAIDDIEARVLQDAINQLSQKRIARSLIGQKNGVAGLGDNGKIPVSQLPGDFIDKNSLLEKLKSVDGPGSGLDADTVDGKQAADFILTSAVSTSVTSDSTTNVASSSAAKASYNKAAEALTLLTKKDKEYQGSFEKLASRNKPNGYPGLDAKGVLSPNILPSATIVNVFTYSSTADRNKFTGHNKGDMAIVEKSGAADLYILKTDPAGKATTDGNWLTLQTSITVDVRSWNNRNGNVMPMLGDYTSGLITHKGKKLDSYLDSLETGIPDSDFYSRAESDNRFLPKNKLSNAIDSSDPTGIASSLAAKAAYNRGTEGLNEARSKLTRATADNLYLPKSGKAPDSDKLAGKPITDFILKSAKSDSVTSTSSDTVATSKSVSQAFTVGNEASRKADGKLDKNAKATDSDKLDNKDSSFFTNASNLNAGTLPAARMPGYRLITANTTLNAYDKVLVDLSNANITVTLPGSPKTGQYVVVVDAMGLADKKALILSRNGQNIMGSAEDMTFNIKGYRCTLIYVNSARGWIVA